MNKQIWIWLNKAGTILSKQVDTLPSHKKIARLQTVLRESQPLESTLFSYQLNSVHSVNNLSLFPRHEYVSRAVRHCKENAVVLADFDI